MRYTYSLLFSLLYCILLSEYCQGNYFFNRYTKDMGRTVRKQIPLDKDYSPPQYIDELVEVPADLLPMFDNLRLAEHSTRSKPGNFPHMKIFMQGLA